jgi:hypothetical protein
MLQTNKILFPLFSSEFDYFFQYVHIASEEGLLDRRGGTV